jgi:hypothetical protein
MSVLNGKCGFAHPGTFGHECGRASTTVGVMRSRSVAGGIFYAARCASCAKIKGGENAGIYQWFPVGFFAGRA